MRLMLLLAVALLVACGPAAEEGTDESAVTPTAPTPDATLDFQQVEIVARGLQIPWDIAFVDERTILVTERAGTVRVVENGSLREQPAARIDVEHRGEGGLLGIAVHPDQHAAFVYYTTARDNRVSRFTLGEDLRFGGEQVILDGIPAAGVHDGGRIAFGPDGMLYVTTGDAGEAARAADRSSLAGKILRIAPDGSIPDDNPFDGSPVYAWGLRNPQGLAWDEDGTLYATEHGPTGEFDLCCHDEVNRIEPGGFYGWPFFAGTTRAMQGGPPAEHIPPVRESGGNNTWAPSGLALHGGALLVTNLRGEQLLRMPPDGDDVEAVLDGQGRLRAAVIGPDDCLYLTTSNRDGRGQPRDGDDRVLRVCGG